VAGVFLFMPLLVKMQLDTIVREAGMAGTKMIPAASYLLSLLSLKLLDKERKSHITDWNFDEALGLFAGLNVLPKDSAATDYSYRTQRVHQEAILQGWMQAFCPRMSPEAKAFSLDSHPIPFRGEPSGLERHYLPRRGRAGPRVLAFFALEQKTRCFCYSAL